MTTNKKTTNKSKRHAQTKSAPQQSATERQAPKADPSSKPRQRLTCQRAEEIVRPIAELYDCDDKGMQSFIELIEGIAHEQDSAHREELAFAIRVKVFPYTRAYGRADQAFFTQHRN